MARPRKAVNITWLGEDHLHEDGAGPSRTVWHLGSNGEKIDFPKGEAIPVTNKHVIEKAKGNQFFEVEGHSKDEPETDE